MDKYTWGEIQIESLKKMFLNNKEIFEKDLDDMRTDNKYRIYLNAMPQAANEGIAELLKRSRPYIKTIQFTQFPLENLTGEEFKTYTYTNDELSFEGQGALSYYFECDNKCTASIYVFDDEWKLVSTVENRAFNPGQFKVFKGFIENPNKGNVKIVFNGGNPYNIRNVALYRNDYDYTGTGLTKYIPDFKPYNIYNLSKLANDFYKIDKIYHENENHELMNRSDYIMEDSVTLVLDKHLTGNFIVKYQPYNEKITLDTSDDEEINLEPEIAAILPLYIASQLYKDDDISLATMYRNEFETALEDKYPRYNDLKFVNKSGWL